jgi:hypothetical protein
MTPEQIDILRWGVVLSVTTVVILYGNYRIDKEKRK